MTEVGVMEHPCTTSDCEAGQHIRKPERVFGVHICADSCDEFWHWQKQMTEWLLNQHTESRKLFPIEMSEYALIVSVT